MRAYMGGFVGESEAEIRRTYPPSFLRGVKIEDEGGGNVNWYLNNVNWPDVPELDLRGMTFRYLNYNGPYKVNIPLRSLSRKALEDLVQVLAK
jgi:hypothetical protein